MSIWISILRGINVGGRNAIKMDALRNMYVQLGFSEVQSYIQSGNVIFKTELTDSKSIEKLISTEIRKTFGFEVPVLVVEREKWRNTIHRNPFLLDSSYDQAYMHITFLSESPDKTFIEKISEGNYRTDEYCFGEKAIYL